MTRNLKAVTMTAIVAIVAVSLMGAAAAQAEPKTFYSEIANPKLTGEQVSDQVWKFAAGTVTCTKTTFTGVEIAQETAETTFSAVYPSANCHNSVSGLSSVKVHMNGCQYRFTVDPKTGIPTTGSTHLQCPVNKKVEITVSAKAGEEGASPACTITLPAQTLTGMVYKSVGTGKTRHFTAIFNATKLHYIQDGFFCPGGAKTFTDGTYAGEVTVKGFNEGGGQIGLWIE